MPRGINAVAQKESLMLRSQIKRPGSHRAKWDTTFIRVHAYTCVSPSCCVGCSDSASFVLTKVSQPLTDAQKTLLWQAMHLYMHRKTEATCPQPPPHLNFLSGTNPWVPIFPLQCIWHNSFSHCNMLFTENKGRKERTSYNSTTWILKIHFEHFYCVSSPPFWTKGYPFWNLVYK